MTSDPYFSPSIRRQPLHPEFFHTVAGAKRSNTSMFSNNLDLDALESACEDQSPEAVLRIAAEHFERVAISFSGAEDVVLIDMAKDFLDQIDVFTLDTGRLHSVTYKFIDKVRDHYGVKIHVMAPEREAVEAFTTEKGFFSFYKDGHKECCGIRKVEPLKRKLATLDAWVTGQRKDQSPTRTNVPVVQHDSAFSTPDHDLIKFNPLANWSSKQVWEYIRTNHVPYNTLHERGFVSVGCVPCTRQVLPGEHEREGRWWWENAEGKECGLHAGNLEEATNGAE